MIFGLSIRWNEQQEKLAMQAENEEEDSTGWKPRVLSASREKGMKATDTLRRMGTWHWMQQVASGDVCEKQDRRGRGQDHKGLRSGWRGCRGLEEQWAPSDGWQRREDRVRVLSWIRSGLRGCTSEVRWGDLSLSVNQEEAKPVFRKHWRWKKQRRVYRGEVLLKGVREEGEKEYKRRPSASHVWGWGMSSSSVGKH